MPHPRNAKLTAADWHRIAWAPSYRGPRAADVLNPPPFAPPGPPAMSAEERRLLDAVIAEPDADAPRLAYAAWADRQGSRRGEFIRQQLAGRDAEPDPAWVAPFAPWGAEDIVFRRGFVESLSLTGRSFITLGGPLFRTTPLREVRLVAVGWYLGELARTPHLAKLESLDLRGNRLGPAGLRQIAAPHLRGLGLAGNDLAGEFDAAAFPRLTDLDLADNGFTAVPAGLPPLSRLRLARNRLPADAKFPPTVQDLDVRHCGVGPAAVAGLPLTSLDAGFCGWGDADVESLPTRLRRLVLRVNHLGPAGAAALARRGLAELDLFGNRVGDAEWNCEMNRLDLGNNGVTAAGVAGLPAGLTTLSLAWNPLGDAGAKALAAWPGFAKLRELDLTGTGLGFAGAKALAESPHPGTLRLHVGENPRLPADVARLLAGRFGTTSA